MTQPLQYFSMEKFMIKPSTYDFESESESVTHCQNLYFSNNKSPKKTFFKDKNISPSYGVD